MRLALPVTLLLAALPDVAAQTPSWYERVLPVVAERCQGCHVTGGIAPFSLETYDEAALRAAAIATMVESRAMPPWKADDTCRPVRNSRRLSDDEVSLIVAWARGGTPAGEPPSVAPVAKAPPALPRVDLTLAMAEPYMPSSARPDDYRCFVLDPRLPGARDLVGYDVLPGQRAMVHHVLLYGAPRSEALARDASEPGPGYACFGGPGVGTGTVYGAWVPGSGMTLYPEETGVTIESDRVIVMQVHYNTAHSGHGAHAPDVTAVQLQFADTPVAKPAMLLPMADLLFTIPPRADGYSSSVTFQSPVKATIHAVGPHMHTLGRSIRVSSGDTCLVNVPEWDFNWQQAYQLVEPFTLEPGMPLTLTCTWSNPTDGSVRWGEGTSDEMCLSYLYVTR
jgi:hypothetical protein